MEQKKALSMETPPDPHSNTNVSFLVFNFTATLNQTIDYADSDQPNQNIPQWVLKLIFVYIHVIVIVGLVGNLVCAFVFVGNSAMNRMSVTQYLLALAISDIVFLISLALSLLEFYRITWAGIWGLCKLSMYLTYLATFLSGWYIMAMTIERAIVIRNPFYACHMRKRRAQAVILIITTIGLLGNTWIVPMYQRDEIATENETIPVCGPTKAAELPIFKVMTSLDTIFSFTIPLLVNFFLNVYMIIRLCQAAKQRAALAPQSRTRASTNESNASSGRHVRGYYSSGREESTTAGDQVSTLLVPSPSFTHTTRSLSPPPPPFALPNHRPPSIRLTSGRNHSSIRDDRSERRITMMLLTVSTTYLVLNLPSYLVRVWAAFRPSHTISVRMAVMEQLFYLLFYTQFAINFVLYSWHGIRSKYEKKQKLNYSCIPTNMVYSSKRPSHEVISRDSPNTRSTGLNSSSLAKNGHLRVSSGSNML